MTGCRPVMNSAVRRCAAARRSASRLPGHSLHEVEAHLFGHALPRLQTRKQMRRSDSQGTRRRFAWVSGGLAGDSLGTLGGLAYVFGGLAPKNGIKSPRFRGTRSRPLWAFIILKSGI